MPGASGAGNRKREPRYDVEDARRDPRTFLKKIKPIRSGTNLGFFCVTVGRRDEFTEKGSRAAHTLWQQNAAHPDRRALLAAEPRSGEFLAAG